MRILFVNHGPIDSNSGNHIVSVAAQLQKRGHACAAAVPGKDAPASAGAFGETLPVHSFADRLRRKGGEAFDLLHLWTPREGVRKFAGAFLEKNPAPWFLHLEDNEQAILERLTGKTLAELGALPRRRLEKTVRDGMIHPVRHRRLLDGAAGITVIYRSIADLLPADLSWHEMLPIIDLELFAPRPRDPDRRRGWGIAGDEKVVCYNGNDHAVNRDDMRALHTALHLLNRDHFPVRLVRTGLVDPRALEGLPFDARRFIVDLGFVPREEIPGIVAEADLAIQPGQPDAFNAYRLPSKIPEYLALGKVVILPEANIAGRLEDGRDAIILKAGTPEAIVEACLRVWTDPALRARVETGARSFAERCFEAQGITEKLEAYYGERLRTAKRAPPAPPRPWWNPRRYLGG